MKQRLLLSTLCCAALFWATMAPHAAMAQTIAGYPDSVEAYDPREVRLLPSYCIHTQVFRDRVPGGNNARMIKQWYAQLGDDFHNMHHYCWGLMKLHRGTFLAQDATTKSIFLRDSLGEFDYVIQRANPEFVMLPEILSKKGDALIRLGRGAAAILDLERAIELNPKYWPPYGHLSDFYKSTGDFKASREWLEKGLAAVPDAKGLTRRLAELDSTSAGQKPKR